MRQCAMAMTVAGAVLMLAVAAAQAPDGPLGAMVNAERSFARMSVEAGLREAFLTFFAPDGVAFAPGPVNGRELYARRPPGRQPRVLDWEPAVASVSASGDLGYSTGPFSVTETATGERVAEGWFFSVWRRQPDGQWRVMADLGVPIPAVGELRPRTFTPITKPVTAASGEKQQAAVSVGQVLELDQRFLNAVGQDAVAAYLARADTQTRLYRAGQIVIGSGTLAGFIGSTPRASCEAIGAGVSTAGDLAYAYGACRIGAADGGAGKPGGYLRVWRRAGRAWVLAAEVMGGA